MAKKSEKPAKKPDAPAGLEDALDKLIEISDMLSVVCVQVLGAANGISSIYGLKGRRMTAQEAQKYQNKVPTPFGEATAPPEGDVPDPANGEEYTVVELSAANFTRPVLSKLLEEMGGEPKGKMAPDLRTEILQIQAGADEKETGECDITGDENVELTLVTVEGEEYRVGPRVIEAVEAGDAQWDDIMDGDYEFEEV